MRTCPMLVVLTALLGVPLPQTRAEELTSAQQKRIEDAFRVFKSDNVRRLELKAAARDLVAMRGPHIRSRLLDEARKTPDESTFYWTCRALLDSSVEAGRAEVASLLMARIENEGKPRPEDTEAIEKAIAAKDEALAERLAKQSEREISPRIIELLGETGDRRALPVLIGKARSSKNSARRSAALLALGRIASPEGTDVILGALDDRDTYARRAAREAMAGLASAPGRAEATARLLADKVRKTEKKHKPPLMRLLGKFDSATARSEVRNYLRRTGEKGILKAALEAAAELKMKDDAELIVDVARDDDQPRHIRELAVRALADIGASEEMEELVPLLESEEGYLRRAAHRALRRLTGKALPPSPDVWSSAVILAEEERAAGGPIEFDPKDLPATPPPQSAADVALAGPPTNPLYYVLAAAAFAAVFGLWALRDSLVRRKAVKIETGRRKIRRRSS